MIIDRDVIFDLLPLCESGLASPASRELVERWLGDHPGEQAGGRGPRVERHDVLEALGRARRLRRRLRWLFGLAIALTVLSFTAQLQFAHGRFVSVRLLALDLPLLFTPIVLAAAGCWFGYFRLKRSLR